MGISATLWVFWLGKDFWLRMFIFYYFIVVRWQAVIKVKRFHTHT